MYNQRLLHHAIADNAAIAAPVERKDIVRDHACGVCLGRNDNSRSVSKRAGDGNLNGLSHLRTARRAGIENPPKWPVERLERRVPRWRKRDEQQRRTGDVVCNPSYTTVAGSPDTVGKMKRTFPAEAPSNG